MNGHYNNDDDEEEDDDAEMVGLLSKSEHDNTNDNASKGKKKKKSCRIKPLEVMYSSTRRRFVSKSSAVACRTGVAMVCLSILIGLWIWSGRKIHDNTGVQRWNNLKLKDIQKWCLDVSFQTKCEATLFFNLLCESYLPYNVSCVYISF